MNNEEGIQIDTSSKPQQQNVEEEKANSDVAAVCHLCGNMVNGPALKWNGIEVDGAIMTHLNNACPYLKNYTARISEAAENWKEYLAEQRLKPYTDIRSFFSSCHEFLTVVASKVEHLPRMKGRVKQDMDGDDIISEEDGEIDQLDSSFTELKSGLSSSVTAF